MAPPKDTLAARHATSRCLRWFRWVQQPENVSLWPVFAVSEPGRARQLCPVTSDLDFLRNLNGIVNLDPKISNRALDLRVAQ